MRVHHESRRAQDDDVDDVGADPDAEVGIGDSGGRAGRHFGGLPLLRLLGERRAAPGVGACCQFPPAGCAGSLGCAGSGAPGAGSCPAGSLGPGPVISRVPPFQPRVHFGAGIPSRAACRVDAGPGAATSRGYTPSRAPGTGLSSRAALRATGRGSARPTHRAGRPGWPPSRTPSSTAARIAATRNASTDASLAASATSGETSPFGGLSGGNCARTAGFDGVEARERASTRRAVERRRHDDEDHGPDERRADPREGVVDRRAEARVAASGSSPSACSSGARRRARSRARRQAAPAGRR